MRPPGFLESQGPLVAPFRGQLAGWLLFLIVCRILRLLGFNVLWALGRYFRSQSGARIYQVRCHHCMVWNVGHAPPLLSFRVTNGPRPLVQPLKTNAVLFGAYKSILRRVCFGFSRDRCLDSDSHDRPRQRDLVAWDESLIAHAHQWCDHLMATLLLRKNSFNDMSTP